MKTITSKAVLNEIHAIETSNLTQEQKAKLNVDKGTLLTIGLFAGVAILAITAYALGLIPKEFM